MNNISCGFVLEVRRCMGGEMFGGIWSVVFVLVRLSQQCGRSLHHFVVLAV